jgi:phenylacetate-CoA ligase
MNSLNNIFTRRVVLPLSDKITRQTISSDLDKLLISQYWSRDQLDEYQNRKLRELIKHSFENVPFYNELMKKHGLTPNDIKTKQDLPKLPIITKDDFRLAQGKHKALNLSPKSYYQNFSSGSTAEPFQFLFSNQSESFSKATNIRAWKWQGYAMGDKYVKLSMNARSSKIKQLQDMVNRCRYLSSTQLNASSFEAMVEKIIEFDPKFLRGQPVPLFFLSEVIAKRYGSYTGKSLLGINTTGSTLHDDVRKKIEDTFHATVFDSYSCEGGANFSECPICGAYHPSEEYAISEFIADSFSASDPDYPLRHITTDLTNYAAPFIRYDTQDYVVLEEESKQNKCSRPFIHVKKIKGRDGDIIVTPSGKYLFDGNFAAYFEYVVEVDIIQVVQNKIDMIDINMVVNTKYNDRVHKAILDYWQEYIGNDVSISLNIVDEIRMLPNGKRRTVIRNPSIKLNG